MGRYLLASVAVALATASCSNSSSSSGGGMGTLQVSAVDDPFQLDLVTEAVVHVTEVKVHRSADADSGFLSLPVAAGGLTIDLVKLRDSVTADLAIGALPVGSYAQARLVVDDGRLTLSNGNVYSTALGNLDLTSVGTSGLKIFITPPIVVVKDQTTHLLLDFDLSKSFLSVPADDPANATKFLLMPGIRATNVVDNAELRGLVTMDDGTGTQVGVATATVYVLPLGETDPANAVASTASVADGSYAFLGLAAGTYDLLAVKDALKGTVAGVVLTAGESTTVDVVIQ